MVLHSPGAGLGFEQFEWYASAQARLRRGEPFARLGAVFEDFFRQREDTCHAIESVTDCGLHAGLSLQPVDGPGAHAEHPLQGRIGKSGACLEARENGWTKSPSDLDVQFQGLRRPCAKCAHTTQKINYPLFCRCHVRLR